MGSARPRSRGLCVALIACASLLIFAFPAAATNHLVTGEQAVVTGTNGHGLNVRSEPSTNSDVHFIAEEGTVMEVTSGPEEAEGITWYGVHVDGYDAWIMADYLVGVGSQAGDQVTVVHTDGHGLRLRADSSSEADTVTVVPEGATLEVVGGEQTDDEGTHWANVQYNGTIGFAHRSYLAVVNSGGEANAPDESTPVEDEPANEPPSSEESLDEQTGNDTAAPDATQEDPAPAPEPVDTGAIAVGGNAEIVDTDGYGLNIRHGAGYSHSVVTVADEGHVVQVLDGPHLDDDGSNWWNVDYRGHNGWAHGDFLQRTDQEPTDPGSASGASDSSNDDAEEDENGQSEGPTASPVGEQIVNEAMQYLGYPYVWGGTSPSGFDCSGFIYYVVNQVTGGDFPRTMEAQVNRGTYIPSDQLQPGDLVFQQNTYQWGLSHAGIYIGDGQFIHAATPGSGVVISNLWDSYWGQRYYTARRI